MVDESFLTDLEATEERLQAELKALGIDSIMAEARDAVAALTSTSDSNTDPTTPRRLSSGGHPVDPSESAAEERPCQYPMLSPSRRLTGAVFSVHVPFELSVLVRTESFHEPSLLTRPHCAAHRCVQTKRRWTSSMTIFN